MPVSRPPALAFISDTVRAGDREGIPPLLYFQARDGSNIAYRHYAPPAPIGRAAVLIHGSSGSSLAVHPLAKMLSARGVESFVPDIRGHGASGTRGDIGYIGQLEDDLADLVDHIRATGSKAPLTLVGHSSGGGFALRVAGSPLQQLFTRTVLLSPYLGNKASSSRENAGGWASPDMPRIVALYVLRRIGIECCKQLPVIAFAVPAKTTRILTAEYSFRLLSNFGAHRDYRADLQGAKGSLTLIAGANEELMFANKYDDAVKGTAANIDVKILESANHMDVVSTAAATSVIADDIASR
ncbi:alpha/beta hydrolase [Bradyrhizobium sp. AZCC 1693]|uniref:alpha/beta hydrolase n=1 Tax=Bradyrhizobium sp. AZCC 1693 TaxID=3117029 RepID=UPI002FF414FD